MKYLPYLIAVFTLLIGFAIGKSTIEKKQEKRSLKEVEKELYTKELEKLDSLITVSAKINESSGYYWDENYYLNVNFTNNSKLVFAKNMKFEIKYLTETNAVLRRDTFSVYKYVYPNNTLKFSRVIDIPNEMNNFEINFLSVEGDSIDVSKKKKKVE